MDQVPPTEHALRAAMIEQRLVRIERRPKFADRLSGFVVRIGSKWALLAREADGGYFDGFIAFRLRDVKRVTADETVAARFAPTQSEWPPHYEGEARLDTTKHVLEDLGAGGLLLGIQKEVERRNALWIGRLDEVLSGYVYLHEIRPDASWHPEPLGYKLKAITTVEIGGRYLDALASIAGIDHTSGI